MDSCAGPIPQASHIVYTCTCTQYSVKAIYQTDDPVPLRYTARSWERGRGRGWGWGWTETLAWPNDPPTTVQQAMGIPGYTQTHNSARIILTM